MLFLPSQQGTTITVPTPRARIYSAFSACLLTGPQGLDDPAAGPVWTALQATSASTHAQISYLAMMGPDTSASAGEYINTLVLRGCSVVLTAGPVPAQGALAQAASWPGHRFIVTEPEPEPAGTASNAPAAASAPASAPDGVTVLTGSGSDLATRIQRLIQPLAAASASRTP